MANADEAYGYLHEAIQETKAIVVLDATGLSFCGAAGLRVLAQAADDARLNSRPFMMAAARPALLRMLQITGLDRAYPELVPIPAQPCHPVGTRGA